jgi:transglutaminase-like putative cysteine protease
LSGVPLTFFTQKQANRPRKSDDATISNRFSWENQQKYVMVRVVRTEYATLVPYQKAWNSTVRRAKVCALTSFPKEEALAELARLRQNCRNTQTAPEPFFVSRSVHVSSIFGQPRQPIALGYRAPLMNSVAGTAQTIKLMRQLVDQALTDSVFLRTTRDIVASVPAHDELGELEAIFNWTLSNIRFTKDPLTKETLFPPQELLKIRAGDCDDFSMLLAAMALSLGYPARLITVAANEGEPQEFSHVYAEVELPAGSGNWVPMDAARPGAQFGKSPEIYFRKRAWSLVDDSYQDLNGNTRRRGLGSYGPVRGLGDDSIDWGSIITQSIQQVPQDIAVAEGQPTALKSPYGTVATGPYASFATAYTPGATIPQAGYTASLTSNSWFLPLVILGLILMVKK